MALTSFTIPVPSPFNFKSAAYSHGWVVLAPTDLNKDDLSLSRTERTSTGKVVDLTIYDGGTDGYPGLLVEVQHKGRLGPKQREELSRSVGRMFRTGEDFSGFYDLCRKMGGNWRKLTDGSGRLLRSPTLYEDIVKTICTTNIQWSGTKSMVRNLVNAFGKEFPLDPERKAFPTPQAIASGTPEMMAAARLGYRGPYILTLSEQVASGTLELGSFEDQEVPTDELRRMLLKIKGVGDYAAATLLMLLGRYECLGFDTEMRDFVAKHYMNGVSPTAQEAFAFYKDWGKWKYLAYWFDNYSE